MKNDSVSNKSEKIAVWLSRLESVLILIVFGLLNYDQMTLGFKNYALTHEFDFYFLAGFLFIWLVGAFIPKAAERLWPWRPAGYITVGLLGTFWGVSHSLQDFSFGSGLAVNNVSIKELLSSVSLAFHTSVIGICASILASISNRLRREHEEETLESQALTVTKENLPKIVESLNGFGKEIGTGVSGAIKSGMTEAMNKWKEMFELESKQRDGYRNQIESDISALIEVTANLNSTSETLKKLDHTFGNMENAAEKMQASGARILDASANLFQSAQKLDDKSVGYVGTLLSRVNEAQQNAAKIAELSNNASEKISEANDVSREMLSAAKRIVGVYGRVAERTKEIVAALDGLDGKLSGVIEGFVTLLSG